jgi:alkyl sulfatase BDS1-like metallo-beta-lactamase superfamily hydrolase
MNECAEMVKLPPSLAGQWYDRDFYGTVNYNVKAVYQRYLGWFDANPANLHPLPPEEASRKYVEFMGGADAVLTRARESMKKGEYRWVAQVVNHVVFAQPRNRDARELQADALEQLGYQSESPIWRNFYLTGAKELRDGVDKNIPVQIGSMDVISNMPLDMFFDMMAIRLNGPKAIDKQITVNWIFTDVNQTFAVTLENSVLNYKRGRLAADPATTVTLTRALLDKIMAKQATFTGRLLAGDIKIEGSTLKFLEMMSCLEDFEFWFNIVTP